MRKNIIFVLLFVLIAVLGFSSFMIVKEFSQREKEKDDFEKLDELVSSESSEQETENQPDEGEIKPVSKRNLAPLFEQNPDCIGWIYLEGTRKLSDDNIVIYGHNMLNGTMFSDITKYAEKTYFDEHRLIEFETAEGLKTYEILA